MSKLQREPKSTDLIPSSVTHRNVLRNKTLSRLEIMLQSSRDLLNMEKLLGELGSSYKCTDHRVVLAKREKASENNDWKAIFLKIVFISKERHEVKRLQEAAQATYWNDLQG